MNKNKYIWIAKSTVYHIIRDTTFNGNQTSLCNMLNGTLTPTVTGDTIPFLPDSKQEGKRHICGHCRLELSKQQEINTEADDLIESLIDEDKDENNYTDNLLQNIIDEVDNSPAIPLPRKDTDEADEIIKELHKDAKPVYYGDLKRKIGEYEEHIERLKMEIIKADFSLVPGDRVKIDGKRYMFVLLTKEPGRIGYVQMGILVDGEGHTFGSLAEATVKDSSVRISQLLESVHTTIYDVCKMPRCTLI